MVTSVKTPTLMGFGLGQCGECALLVCNTRRKNSLPAVVCVVSNVVEKPSPACFVKKSCEILGVEQRIGQSWYLQYENWESRSIIQHVLFALIIDVISVSMPSFDKVPIQQLSLAP